MPLASSLTPPPTAGRAAAGRRAGGGRRGARGFTLIELFYAVGLFMIGLDGLVVFQLVASYGTARAADITVATNLASAAIESAKARPWGDVVNRPQPMVSYGDRFGVPQPSASFFTVSAQAAPPTPNSTYYDLQVTVSWKHYVKDTFVHSIAMETLIPTE